MSPKKTIFPKRNIGKYQQRPRKGRKIIRWIVAIVILVILFIFLSGNRSLFKLYSLRLDKNKLQQQKQDLIERQKNLETEIDKLENDPDYIEKKAREKYNMKKEYEEVYIAEPE
jgi:cell division protein FtsB